MKWLLLSTMCCAAACGPSESSRPSPSPRPSRPATTAEGGEQPPPSEPPGAAAVVLAPPGGEPVSVRVEVADTDPERERGLMYRRELASDAGMLFVFDGMEHLSFWMENTYIPLDMIFIDDSRRVVGVVADAEPLTEDAREVEGESQYVLEVNAGFARRHGIGPGTDVRFENVGEVEDAAD